MAKYLVIVESPAKSKTIKKYLGSSYKVEASMGHIRDLPKSKLGIDIKNNFEPEYINIRGKGDLIKKLRQECKNSDKIFLATDPDREGEAISWHLLNALNLADKNVTRIEFHEITETAVKNAIKNAREIDMNLVDAQQARRLLDRIVGYQISPLLWRKIAKGLSAGRVQSVALKIICDREDIILNFIPVEYWTVKAFLKQKKETKGVFTANLIERDKQKIEIKSEEESNRIAQELKKGDFVVSDLKLGVKNRNPYLPFKTSTLQQSAFSRLGFGTRKTMQIAQQLYEGVNTKLEGYVGLITYMRTDSTRLSEEFKQSTSDYIAECFGKEYTGNLYRKEKASKNTQDAHEGVRVTSPSRTPESLKDQLTSDQYKLYKLIWERTLSSLMAAAEYDTVTAEIQNGAYKLRASGSSIKFDGFLRIYADAKGEEEEEKNPIPKELKVGDQLILDELEEKQHFTEPPPRFTEASLVKELEENGIGRPSTYATIISTIIDRQYITKELNKLMPTELGNIVNGLMVEHFEDIVDTEFTAKLEEGLDEIASGDRKWKEILKDFYVGFEKELELADQSIEKVELKEEESDEVCEKCGRKMVIKQGRFGKFLACPGFPDCKNAKPIVVKTGVTCPKCGGEILEKKSKKGKKYYACSNTPTCDALFWDRPTGEKCKVCGSLLLEKGYKTKTIYCSNQECKTNPGPKKGVEKSKKAKKE